MRSSSANYDTELAKAQKKPVVIVEFSGVTRKYSSGTFNNITANHKKLLVSVNTNLQNMELLSQPLAVSGNTSFVVLDEDLDATSTLQNNALTGVDITVKQGFQSLDDTDAISLPTTTVDQIELESDKLGWRFISKDARKLILERIARAPGRDSLNGALNATSASIVLNSATGFVDPANNPDYIADTSGTKNNFVKIDNEIIRYTTVTGATLSGGGRGAMGTDAVTHEDEAPVEQLYTWTSNYSHEMLLNILMTTNDGSGHAYYDLASFDAGYEEMGLGLTASKVDVQAIERIGYKSMAGNQFMLTGAPFTNESALTVIEEQILKPNGWYMYLDGTDKLTVDSFDRIHIEDAYSADDTFVDAEIIDGQFTIREDLLINEIEIHSGLNALTRQPMTKNAGFGQVRKYELDNSVTNYNRIEKPHVITTPLNTSTASDDDVVNTYLYKWFYFWGNVPGTFEMSTLFEKILTEPGDYVNITYDKLPELTDGTRGWSAKKSIITGQTVNWLSAAGGVNRYKGITWELFDRVDPMVTVTATIAQGSIDDTDLAFSATSSDTLEAADAYVDISPTANNQQWCLFKITVTPPNETPPGSHEWVELFFRIQDTTPVGVGTFAKQSYNYIHYFTEDSAAFDLSFMLISRATFNMDRAKIDWFDRSTATGGKQPTLTFKEFKYGTLDEAMSTA